MTEDRLAQIIEATATELLAAFDKASAIKHEGSKGAVREAKLLEFIKSRLPDTVRAVGSSEIIDAAGATSLQQDIVIVDPSTPAFLYEGAQRVYPAECVQGVIEVKGRLTKHEVFDACNKIASVKRLQKVHYHPDPLRRTFPSLRQEAPLNHRPTFGFMFAYEAQTRLQTVASNVLEWCSEHPPEEWPDGLYVLTQGTLGWFRDGTFFESVVPRSRLCRIETTRPRDVLLAMILNLHQAYVTAWMPPFRIHNYLPATELGQASWTEPPNPTWPEDVRTTE